MVTSRRAPRCRSRAPSFLEQSVLRVPGANTREDVRIHCHVGVRRADVARLTDAAVFSSLQRPEGARHEGPTRGRIDHSTPDGDGRRRPGAGAEAPHPVAAGRRVRQRRGRHSHRHRTQERDGRANDVLRGRPPGLHRGTAAVRVLLERGRRGARAPVQGRRLSARRTPGRAERAHQGRRVRGSG